MNEMAQLVMQASPKEENQVRDTRQPNAREIAVNDLIKELTSIVHGEEAVGDLMACGEEAVEPLRRFLMDGQPCGIYQPRRWAVEALAGLEAKDVLLEYLRHDRPVADEVARMGEEAVQNAAAIALSRWPGEDVYELLMGILRGRHLSGAIATLGELRHAEAIPYIVAALEDSVCRGTAEEALRKMGTSSIPELIRAVLNPRPNRDEESPSSLLRRISASRFLAGIGLSKEQWTEVAALIDEASPEILVAACRMAKGAGDEERLQTLAGRLIRSMTHADWYISQEIEDVLVDIYDVARPLVEQEITRHSVPPPCEDRVFDPVLRTLIRVRQRARGES